MSNTIKDDNQYLLEEWKECRASIDRFDGIIVDIRKYGFTLITGMLTADAFLFVKMSELSFTGKISISILTMVLVFALFVVDRYHEVFLRGAVQRAKEIEDTLRKKLISDISLTCKISDLSEINKTDTWGARTYSIFIAASAIPSWTTTVENSLNIKENMKLLIITIVAVLIFEALIWIYHLTRSYSEKNQKQQ